MAGWFTVALCLLLLLPEWIEFEWRSGSGIIGWLAVQRYPKQQEFFYFATSMLGIPVVMTGGWWLFSILSRGLVRFCRLPDRRVQVMLAAVHLLFLSAWPALWRLDERALRALVTPVAVGVLPVLFVTGLAHYLIQRGIGAASTPDGAVAAPSGTCRSVPRQCRSIPVWLRASGRVLSGILAYGLIPAVLYAVAYNPSIDGAACLFHDAEFLVPVQLIGRGAIPYRDIYLQHGLLHNAWIPWLGSRLFEPTLAGVRSLHRYVEPLHLIGAYFLALATFRLPLLTAPVAAVMLLSAGTGGRGFLGYLSLAMLAASIRGNGSSDGVEGVSTEARATASGVRRAIKRCRDGWRLVMAGLLAMLAFWHSVEVGLYSLATGCLITGIHGISRSRRVKPAHGAIHLAYFLGGAMIGFWSIGWFFLLHGALGDLVQNVWIQCVYQTEIWGLAMPPFREAVRPVLEAGDRVAFMAALQRPPMHFHIGAIALALSVAVLTCRAFDEGFWLSPWAPRLLVLTIAGICFYRTVLGRSDIWHTGYSLFFSTLLGLFAVSALLAAGFDRVADRSRGLPSRIIGGLSILTLAVLAGVEMYRYGRDRWDPFSRFAERWRQVSFPMPVTAAQSEPLPSAGNVDMGRQPTAVKPVLDFIRAHSEPHEPVFDFSNQPAYLFFADRLPPSRYFLAAYASLPAMQHEVIADLERQHVNLVIFAGGNWADRIDGVSQARRLPIIAAYLDAHFGPPENVGRVAFRRRMARVGEGWRSH